MESYKMSSPTITADEAAVSALYHRLLDSWNRRDADSYAELIAEDGNLVGFDGSQMNGQAEVLAELRRIFNDHQPAAYIGKIKEVLPERVMHLSSEDFALTLNPSPSERGT